MDELRGPLPEDFPGFAALADAGINTYAQARKNLDTLTDIPGIGESTAEKIRAILNDGAFAPPTDGQIDDATKFGVAKDGPIVPGSSVSPRPDGKPSPVDEPTEVPDFAAGPNTPAPLPEGEVQMFGTDGQPTDDPLQNEPNPAKRPKLVSTIGTPIKVGQFAERYQLKEGVGAVEFKVDRVGIAAIERGDPVLFQGFPIEAGVNDKDEPVYFVTVNGTRLDDGGYLVQNEALEVRPMSRKQFEGLYKKILG